MASSRGVDWRHEVRSRFIAGNGRMVQPYGTSSARLRKTRVRKTLRITRVSIKMGPCKPVNVEPQVVDIKVPLSSLFKRSVHQYLSLRQNSSHSRRHFSPFTANRSHTITSAFTSSPSIPWRNRVALPTVHVQTG